MTVTDNATTDTAAAEAFTSRMVGVLNHAATALLLSIGHQTGLFDTMAVLPTATSAQIADAAGLNERYVREWLGGIVSARIAEYRPESGTYTLPRHHIPALTRAGGLDNVAKMTQYIAICGEVEQKVVGCFRNGGGLPYSEFPRFHEVRAEEARSVVDAGLIDVTLPLVDGLPERLRAGVDVADFGCGSGHAVNVMARAFPASRFTGYDFAEEPVAVARAEAVALGVTNATFRAQDLVELDVVEAFDVITAFDAIHDQVQPAKVLANIARALRPGGVLLIVDIKASSYLQDNVDIPWASYLYTISTMHCMTVSLSAGGTGLGAVWGNQLATSMLADAGFGNVVVREVETDPFNSYYIAGK